VFWQWGFSEGKPDHESLLVEKMQRGVLFPVPDFSLSEFYLVIEVS
jgi:hypothetical protein